MGIYFKVILSLCLLILSGITVSAAAPERPVPLLSSAVQFSAGITDLSVRPGFPETATKGGIPRLATEFLLTTKTTSVWQSENWVGQYRTTYDYNSRNQVSRETYEFYYSPLGVWRYNYRVTFYFDAEHRIEVAVADIWNGEAWMWHSNTTITYDVDGNMIEQFQEGGANTLQTYTYDNEGRLIEFVLQRTDDLLDPWQNYFRYQNSYDGSSIYPSENIQQEWVGGEWVNRDRYRYTYYMFGLYQEMFHDTWAADEWSAYAQSFYTYGDNDWLEEILYQRWYSDAWHDDTKTVITRDAHGNVLMEVGLNKMTGDWGYASKIEYVWDEETTDTPEAGSVNPQYFSLDQNSPNPFNASTAISFTLPSRQDVLIRVYNILGQEVRELAGGSYSAGEHTVIWDGSDRAGRTVSSGIYFYSIEASGKVLTKKMVLLK